MNFADLIPAEEIWRESLLAKLRDYLPVRTYERLNDCNRENLYRTCKSCGDWKRFPYHCNLKWCPLCNWRISRRREELLREWVAHIKQPKHLVLTRSNFALLTRTKVRSHGKDLAALRRTKCFSTVNGGCASTEITNSGNGWHLHTHLLVDTRWIDMPELQATWAKQIGQDLAITKVKDARGKEYLGEVTKYVCKPAEMVSWKPDDIWQFIKAIERTRFFATFGSLFAQGPEVRRAIAIRKHEKSNGATCECGCSEFVWRDETTQNLADIRRGLRAHCRRDRLPHRPAAPRPEPAIQAPELPLHQL